jgi:hypothetical protein
MNTLQTALNIIHKCGERADDWDEWADTELHEFLVMLVLTYAPGTMARAMITHYEEHIEVQATMLKEDYDPATGLDEYGDDNKGDLLDKQHCEESLQLLRQFAETYERHNDEMNSLCAVED